MQAVQRPAPPSPGLAPFFHRSSKAGHTFEGGSVGASTGRCSETLHMRAPACMKLDTTWSTAVLRERFASAFACGHVAHHGQSRDRP